MRPLARRFLKASLLVGAVCDAALSLAMLYAPDTLAGILGLRRPAETAFLDLAAVFLLALALFHSASAACVGRAPVLAAAAAAGRLLAFFCLFSLWSTGYPRSFLGFALAALALALAHGGFLIWALAGDVPEGSTAT